MRVGMEASGHARWFERLLGELQFELWIGDAAEIQSTRACCSRRVLPQVRASPALACRAPIYEGSVFPGRALDC